MTRLNSLLAAAVLALAAQPASADAIGVSDPYVRAVPPGQRNSAAFMSLTNGSAQARALVGAESEAAEVVELHTHVEEGGVMRMRRVDEIALPAGETVELRPGGLHVMLIDLTTQLAPGGEVALELRFDDGSAVSVTAPVRKIDMSQMPHHR